VTHVNIGKVHSDSYKALAHLDQKVAEATAAAGVGHQLVELVKIRVSQLNGCAFCLRIHTRGAIDHGETADRLAVLPAWWESQYFTDAERAALLLAEQVTLIGDHSNAPDRGPVPDGVLSDAQVSALTWLVIVMNAWNRVAVSSHYPVGP
jgi:AhpD family alkylhydroperoxidase